MNASAGETPSKRDLIPLVDVNNARLERQDPDTQFQQAQLKLNENDFIYLTLTELPILKVKRRLTRRERVYESFLKIPDSQK